MWKKIKKFLINFSLFVFVSLLLLVLAEMGANVMVKAGKGQRQQIYGKSDNLVIPSENKELGFVFKPYYVSSDGDTITNALGFHEYDWDPAVLDKSHVILNIGDSITFGAFIKSKDDVYGKVLQYALRQQFPDDDIVVYNAGIGGYNIWQEQTMLKLMQERMPVQMVLLGLCLNDASPMLYVDRNVKGAVVNVPGKLESVKDVFSRKFFNRSKVYVIFKEAFKSFQRKYPNLFPSRFLWYNAMVNGIGWKSLKATLADMHMALEKEGIPLVVAIFPYAHQLQLEDKDNIVQNDLLAFCRQEGIPCLDLYTAYKEGDDAVVWDEEGIHPDEAGHRIAGEAISQFLIQKKLVPFTE